MTDKAKAAVCTEIRTKHSTKSEHHVEFLNVKLAVRSEPARLIRDPGSGSPCYRNAFTDWTPPESWLDSLQSLEKKYLLTTFFFFFFFLRLYNF
jgi:hypothetical protein